MSRLEITPRQLSRVPQSQDPSRLPLSVTLTSPVQPGQVAPVHVETAGAEPGIYFLNIQATGGGVTKTAQLALVVD